MSEKSREQPRRVSPYPLEEAGLTLADATALADQVNRLLERLPPEQCWRELTKSSLNPTVPFAVHFRLYHEIFAGWGVAKPAWTPAAEEIRDANITRFAAANGLDGFPALRRWASDNREAFWEAVLTTLGVAFKTPFSDVLSMERDPENARWLAGAVLNITDSCFHADPDKIAIVSQVEGQPLRRTSYAELLAFSNRVANGLRDRGFRVGDRIGVMAAMTPESVAAYLGMIRAGCVPVSIADSFAPPEIGIRMKLAGASTIMISDVILRGGKTLPCYEKLASVDGAPKAIVIPNSGRCETSLTAGDQSLDDFLSSNDQFESVGVDADAESNILFSSGTTGEPKAIPWTHTTPIKCASDAYFHHNISEDSIVAWPTNLGWMMGPWLIYASLVNRGTIALYNGAPTSGEFCRFVEEAEVTMLGVVPSLVSSWQATGAVDEADWSKIRTFSSTGECSNPKDMLWLMSRAHYRPIVEYCGGTEIGGGYITGAVVEPCSPSVFTTPTLGLDFEILRDGKPAELGEVYLKPPSIGLSNRLLNGDHHATYYATAPMIDGGDQLRRHGDEMERLPGGGYRAHGRTDDTMNLGGIKVSSIELESRLNQLPEVRETAAVAVSPGDGGPSELVVFAVAASEPLEEEVVRDRMQRTLRSELNPLFKISRVVQIDALPRTASNKVMRRKLRDAATTS